MKIGTFSAAFCFVMVSGATRAECLQEAGNFAERICGQVKTIGKSTLITAKGDLTAEAKGLIAKAVGQLGGSVGGSVETKDFENVLQEQLGSELVNVRKCGIEMAKVAMDQVCTRAVIYKTCANQAFGLERWENSERLNGTTGWRDGGYNPVAYCTDFTNSVVRGRGLGSLPHHVDGITPREEKRRTGTFREHAQYNYHCGITLHWNPIYNRKADPLCGTE
ncbi:hypothetical protein [Methylorubrum thiocyanatum]|uniref:hypothetical protein n=1 Tax=Methylorubrum thiocyanatum TaxID=47958 RepID=UPI003658C6D1